MILQLSGKQKKKEEVSRKQSEKDGTCKIKRYQILETVLFYETSLCVVCVTR